jgi:DNA-binding response OmpR family regulator
MLQQLRNMKDPPFLIVASPFADERLWAEALNVGAYDVLAKPFDANEVIRTLSSAWRRWRGQHGQLNEVAGRKAFAALAGESARNEGSLYPISR